MEKTATLHPLWRALRTKGGAESGLGVLQRDGRHPQEPRRPGWSRCRWTSCGGAACLRKRPFLEPSAARTQSASLRGTPSGRGRPQSAGSEAASVPMPSMRVRSTPAKRHSSVRTVLWPPRRLNRLFLDRIGMGGHGLVAVLHRSAALGFPPGCVPHRPRSRVESCRRASAPT